MPAGRPKKSRQEHILNGNPSRRPLPPVDPGLRTDIKTNIDVSKPPKHLTTYGKKYFKSLIGIGQWLTKGDLPLITTACELAEIINNINKDIAEVKKQNAGIKGMESGEVYEFINTNGTSTLKAHPLSTQRKSYTDTLIKCLTTLGFSPSNRTNIACDKDFAKSTDKTAEFFD